MTQTRTDNMNTRFISVASIDISNSGEVVIDPMDGETFYDFSLSALNEDSTYTYAIKIQVSDSPTEPAAASKQWVSWVDEYGASSWTVAAADGTFAAHFHARHKWWRVYATSNSASFGSKATIHAMLSR